MLIEGSSTENLNRPSLGQGDHRIAPDRPHPAERHVQDEDYEEVLVERSAVTRTQALKKVREGREAGREPNENDQKPRKTTETQGPCPNLRGTCMYQKPCQTENSSARVFDQARRSGQVSPSERSDATLNPHPLHQDLNSGNSSSSRGGC